MAILGNLPPALRSVHYFSSREHHSLHSRHQCSCCHHPCHHYSSMHRRHRRSHHHHHHHHHLRHFCSSSNSRRLSTTNISFVGIGHGHHTVPAAPAPLLIDYEGGMFSVSGLKQAGRCPSYRYNVDYRSSWRGLLLLIWWLS